MYFPSRLKWETNHNLNIFSPRTTSTFLQVCNMETLCPKINSSLIRASKPSAEKHISWVRNKPRVGARVKIHASGVIQWLVMSWRHRCLIFGKHGRKEDVFAQLQSQPPVHRAQTLASCHSNRQVRKSWFFSLLPHSSDTQYLPTGSGKQDDLVKDAHCCPLLPTAPCLHHEGNRTA